MAFKIKWWQLFIYEVAVLALGIILGAYFSDILSDYLYLAMTVFVISSIYVVYFLINQTEV